MTGLRSEATPIGSSPFVNDRYNVNIVRLGPDGPPSSLPDVIILLFIYLFVFFAFYPTEEPSPRLDYIVGN